jgi:hypothetical protein
MQFVSNFDKNKPTPQNVVTEGEAGDLITLVPGKMGSDVPLTYYQKTKVPVGTILTVVGPKVVNQGKSWYPIAPAAGDFRYVAKQLVKAEKPVNTSFTIRESSTNIPPASIPTASSSFPPQPSSTTSIIGAPVAVGPAGGTPSTTSTAGTPSSVVTTPPPAPAPVVNNPIWAQAEAAEQAGRLDEAEKLYFQLARQMNEPGGDHDIANLCYTRIHGIREKKKTAGTVSGTVTTAPRPPVSPPQQSRAISATTIDTPKPNDPSQKPNYIGTGKLSRSALDYNGFMTYSLETSPGEVLCYVQAAQGVDLVKYKNKRVVIYGSSDGKRDLSKPLAVATDVELAQ